MPRRVPNASVGPLVGFDLARRWKSEIGAVTSAGPGRTRCRQRGVISQVIGPAAHQGVEGDGAKAVIPTATASQPPRRQRRREPERPPRTLAGSSRSPMVAGNGIVSQDPGRVVFRVFSLWG